LAFFHRKHPGIFFCFLALENGAGFPFVFSGFLEKSGFFFRVLTLYKSAKNGFGKIPNPVSREIFPPANVSL
jgi:hypothetical protein